ncbi:MAG: hypothetical protein ACRDBQ_06795 [Shewanella sp.]
MKISNSKKELARIISENGGWQEYCEWAVQDKSGEFGEKSVILFEGEDRPVIGKVGKLEWMCSGGFESDSSFGRHVCNANKLIKNWHQCILSREEYFHLYPATDADGWIEFDGTERPSGYFNKMIDVKLQDGRVLTDSSGRFEWDTDGASRIIAYRLHKHEQAKPEFCESVTRSIPEPETKPTIEQLAADYRNRKDYADRKQQEADAAKADADAKLAELVAAGKAIGLVVSVETTESKCPDGVMQITKRSQLEIGDVIWIGRSGVKDDERRLPEGEYQVVKVGTIGVLHNGSTFYPDFSFRSWRFIRRP